MQQKKIIFLGSKPIGYKCFEYLLAKKDELGLDIIGLLTQPRKEFGEGSDLNDLASKSNIPIYNSLAEMPECDIIYSVQYHEILKQEHIDKARQIAVNLHMAPLPEYRGSNQFSYAIIEGKKEFGVTIHKINTGIDSGDILFQKRFPIPVGSWVNDLYEATFNASLKLFQYTFQHIIEGKYNPMPQAMLIPKYGTSLHFRNEIAKLKVIDLNWDKEKIERYIRATNMPGFPPPYFYLDGKKVSFATSEK